MVSPLLFIFMLLGIEENLHKNVMYSLFADDLAIYVRENDISKLINNLQLA